MKSEIKKGVVLNYSLILVSSLIGIIYTPILVKCLGQSEYGLYSLVNSIIGYMYILDFGLGSAIIVFASKTKDEKYTLNQLYGMFKTIYAVISIITLILGIILSLNVGSFFGATMTSQELSKAKILMLILTLNLTLNFATTIYNSIITFNEKFVFQNSLTLIITIIKPFITLPLLILGFKSISLSVITTIVNIGHIYLNYLYCKKKLDIRVKCCKVDKLLLKQIFAYSFFIFLNAIVDKINWNVDQVILGAVSGTVAVSIYAIAAQINTMYLNFSTAVSNIMLPKISKIVVKKNSGDQINDEFVKVGRIQYYVLFLILTGFIIFGQDFIKIWVGEQYATSYFIALILIIPVTVPLIQNLGISILQAKGLHKFRSIVYVFMAIANIFISIPLAKNYGEVGTAVGTAISLFVGNILIMNIYYYKKADINIPRFWKNIFNMTIKELIPCLLILFLVSITNLSGFLNLMIFIPLYCIIYIFYSYKLVFNHYERQIADKFIKKLAVFKRWKKS